MRGFARLLIVPVALAASVAVSSAQTAAPKDPMIGTWNLNVAKSSFPGRAPQSIRRTFDYTKDGLILVTYETVNAEGNRSFTHWYLGVDGKEYPEFGRSTGAKPTWWLAGKVIDPYTKEVRDRRVVEEGQREQIIMYTIVVSQDGKTLTMTGKSTNAEGQPTTTVAVYDKVF